MIKQAIVINDLNGNPIQVCEIKNFENAQEFLKYKKELQEKSSKVAEDYENRIAELERRLKLVELELKYNRGEIEEKEYKELCGTK